MPGDRDNPRTTVVLPHVSRETLETYGDVRQALDQWLFTLSEWTMPPGEPQVIAMVADIQEALDCLGEWLGDRAP